MGENTQDKAQTGIGTVFVEDLRLGMSRSLTKRIDPDLVEKFAAVSEDWNPIHFDDAAGQASVFGQKVAHGMLSASLFSGLLGERLPGHGTIYLGQSLRFHGPVAIGDTVTATVTVNEIRADKRKVTLTCEARVGSRLVISGEATVLAPSRT
ncbi:MAG: MaoC family dehydratase [Qingshengfaniella sp.]